MGEKELALEIKKTTKKLKDALENSGVAIFQQDLKLRYTWIFNSHPGMPGMGGADVMGLTEADWLPPDEAKALSGLKALALKGQSGNRRTIKTTPSGLGKEETYYNDVRVEPILKRGKVVGVYTIAIDITHLHTNLMRLEHLNGQLLEHMENVLDKG